MKNLKSKKEVMQMNSAKKFGQFTKERYNPKISKQTKKEHICVYPLDWITGRTVCLLSRTEEYIWYILRFDSQITDIREHFRLDSDEVKRIASEKNLSDFLKDDKDITVTFLVDFKDGESMAFLLYEDEFDMQQNCIKQEIIKSYWEKRNVHVSVVFKNQINKIYAENIRDVVRYYWRGYVFDDVSLTKYYIANRMLEINLRTKRIDFVTLAKNLNNSCEKNG